MIFHIRCPNGHVLQIEEAHLGHQIQCPVCQFSMMVEAPAQPAVSPPPLPAQQPEIIDAEVVEESAESLHSDADWRPRKRRGTVSKRQRLFLARIGLTFHYIKILCFLASMLALTFGVFLAYFAVHAPSPGAGVISGIVVIIYFVLFAVAPLFGVIGSLLCAWVPRKTGGKELIVVSFIMDAVGLVIYGGCQVVSLVTTVAAGSKADATTGPAAVMSGIVVVGSIAGLFMMLAAWILFLLFLRALFVYYEDDNMVEEMRSLIVLTAAVVIGTPFYFAIGFGLAMFIAVRTNFIVGGVLVVGLVVAWLLKMANMMLRLMAVISGARSYL